MKGKEGRVIKVNDIGGGFGRWKKGWLMGVFNYYFIFVFFGCYINENFCIKCIMVKCCWLDIVGWIEWIIVFVR